MNQLKGPPLVKGPVLVIGTGLLGTSIGLGLSQRGVSVLLSDPSPSAVAVAVDIGAGSPLPEESVRPELVVVAAPPDVCGRLVVESLAQFPDAVVTDVASIKAPVLAEVKACAAQEGVELDRYVGSHPMAGRERSGAVSARGELFQAASWVICPHEKSSEAALNVVEGLARDLGADVRYLSPEAHDAAVALVSHTPQVLASLMAARLQDAAGEELSLAGAGLRDVTRIAASAPQLWVQILGGNAVQVAAVLHAVQTDLLEVLGALDAPTAAGARLQLAKTIAAGNAGQARIPGKHGETPQSYAWLTVLVDDRPGQIAQLLTEIGEIGVNIEDLRLDHSAGRHVGMVEISVLPSVREELIAELSIRDWQVVE